MPTFKFGNKTLKIKITEEFSNEEKHSQGKIRSPAAALSELQKRTLAFDRLVSTLRTALLGSFEVSIDVFSELIDSHIDLSLQLSNFFQKGGWRTSRPNPDIEFYDKTYDWRTGENTSALDELGNASQKITYKLGVHLHSTSLAKWFKDLSLAMVALKRESATSNDFKKLLQPFDASIRKTSRNRAKTYYGFRHRYRQRKEL